MNESLMSRKAIWVPKHAYYFSLSPRLTEPTQLWPAAGSWKLLSLKYIHGSSANNHGKCMKLNICPPQKWPIVTQEFTMTKLAILAWRYLYLQNLGICNSFLTTANLSYGQKCCPFGDHTNVTHDLQFLSFEQRLRCVHHSQAIPITYTFLVADCWFISVHDTERLKPNLKTANFARTDTYCHSLILPRFGTPCLLLLVHHLPCSCVGLNLKSPKKGFL